MYKLYFFALCLSVYEFTTYSANDMIMPGMVTIVTNFHASLDYVALSLILYMLGECFVQLWLGAIADVFGKRIVILSGNFLFLLFTLIIAISTNIKQFMWGRFFQGTGMAFIASGYAVIHEQFNDENAVQLISFMLNLSVLSVLIGPIIGVYIINLSSWHYVFIINAILAAVTLIGFSYFTPKDKFKTKQFCLKESISNYLIIIKNKNYLLGVWSNAINALPLIIWIALAPNMMLHHLQFTYYKYIKYQTITVSGLVISSILMQFTIKKLKLIQLIFIGSYISFIGILFSLFFHHFILLVVIGFFFYSLGLGFSNSCIARMVMRDHVDFSQNIKASLMTLCRTLLFIIGVQISNIVCSRFDYSVNSFIVCCFACTLISIISIHRFYALEKSSYEF